MTSQSITGQRDFSNYDMLDAMISSALKETSRQACSLPKKVSVEEQQIASMIYEHFRATGAYEAVKELSDLFDIRLQSDEVQDLDV